MVFQLNVSLAMPVTCTCTACPVACWTAGCGRDDPAPWVTTCVPTAAGAPLPPRWKQPCICHQSEVPSWEPVPCAVTQARTLQVVFSGISGTAEVLFPGPQLTGVAPVVW